MRRAGKVWYGVLEGVETTATVGGGGGAQQQAAAAAKKQESEVDGGVDWAPARKLLVWRATGEVVGSFEALESKLFAMGWERDTAAAATAGRRQYQRAPAGLLVLPDLEFRRLRPIHLFHIAVRTRSAFDVRDVTLPTYAGPRHR